MNMSHVLLTGILAAVASPVIAQDHHHAQRYEDRQYEHPSQWRRDHPTHPRHPPKGVQEHRQPFYVLDRNRNGVISYAELPRYHALRYEWKRVDTNRDGVISRREYSRWVTYPYRY